MKTKKIALLLLITTVIAVPLLSCGGNESSNNTTTTTANSTESGDNQAEATPEDTSERTASDIEPKPAYPELPVEDLGGYNFRIICRSYEADTHWWNPDISVEEETGDPINDAVYLRNKAIEEKYNITITGIATTDVSGKVRTSVTAGSDEYDVMVTGLNITLPEEGILYDLNHVPYVNLEKPWWDQLAVEQLSITDKLFFTSSDLTIRDKDAAIILMFSKTIAQDYELDNLYELVLNGKWTLNKMYDMMKEVSTDLNGDGAIDDTDRVGLLTQTNHTFMLYNAAGESTVRLNADKIPELTLYNQRAVEITELVREMMKDKNYTLNVNEYTSKYKDIWAELQIPMFAEDRALFCHAGMNRVTLLRTMETDFGIIPPPKFDEAQENYHVTVDPYCTSAVGIPATVPNIETTGLILEALTYESRYTLLPAYYNVQLKTKMTRDEESKEMIDIILNSRMYDLGKVYSWSNLITFFDNLISQPATLTTHMERNERRIINAMEKTIGKFEALE